jgi:DNA-binding HxlR family transcriptional regulator
MNSARRKQDVKPETLRVHQPIPTKARSIDQSPLSGNERYVLERKVLSQVKKTPRFLLRELFDFFQGRADCFPSNALVSEASGISERNIQLVLRQLEKAEILRCVEDLTIHSQRRLVLLEHPNAMSVLKALNALPEWLDRWVSRETPGSAMVAPRKEPGGAMVAREGAQNLQTGGAMVAPEALNEKPPSRNRVFKALRGMNTGGA